MRLRARINNHDFPLLDCKITYERNSLGMVEFTALQRDVFMLAPFLAPYEIIFDGNVLISGIVYAEPEIELSDDRILQTKFFAYDELGRLWRDYGAISDGHYQDIRVTDIVLDQLNSNTTDWQLGSIATMVDPTVATTVDLRSKETRWAQVVEAVRSVPQLSVRYGGQVAGFYTVDIGAFGGRHPEAIIQGGNLLSLKKQKSARQQLRRIEGFGGKSGDTVITLENAVNFNPAILTDPFYPVVNIGSYWFVDNVAVGTAGCVRRLDFDKHATDNQDVPTQAQLDEAGFALYQDCIREFQKQEAEESFTVECLLDGTPPLIGDSIYIRGDAVETIHDSVTGREEIVQTFAVDGFYFVNKLTIDIKDEFFFYTIEVSDNQFEDFVDGDVAVYERLEKTDKFNRSRAITGATFRIQSVTEGPGLPGNCLNPGPPALTGRTISVPLGQVPAGSTNVTYSVSFNPADATFDPASVVEPALPATGWSACVSPAGGWNVASVVTVTVTYIFS